MVSIENLNKMFNKVHVLKDINLSLERGKSYAILGPNGSGKTTLVKSILGLVIPDSGSISIDKINVMQGCEYKSKIGYLPQIARFPENLTVQELIEMICDIRKLKKDPKELIAEFQLDKFLKQSLRYLSGGTRQKVNVVLSLLFDPQLYIFDEPTVGLDPVSRIKFKDRVLEEKKKRKSIILVTHLMNEVEELADDIIFLLEGVIHYKGTPEDLKIKYQQTSLEKSIACLLEQKIYD